MNLEYIYKNVYFMNSYIDFESKKIPVYYTARTVKFKMFSTFDKHFNKDIFEIVDDGSKISLNIHYDRNIKLDGYDLEITKKAINIKANSERAASYAINVLNNLVSFKQNKARLPLIHIYDEPSFRYRGIIEGYYGEPWSFESRKDLANFMSKHRLNTYMYAPKSDPYHRVKWNELYPEAELKNLVDFKNSLENNYIDFYYCLSPGYTKGGGKIFEYVKEEDFELLFKKFDQVVEQGITKFGLLLDDIDYKLSGANLEKFKRPGIAHAHICNVIYNYLSNKVIDLEVVMCPTEYHQIGESEYRNDLRTLLNENIKVFWTGDNVCAEVITDYQAEVTKDAFGHNLFIWDNFPVTDFTYGVRQYMGPIVNRTADLNKYASGYIINPMNLYEISKIAMITQAHFAWNSYKYDSKTSFEIALKEIGEDFYKQGLAYVNYNLPSVLTHGYRDYELKLLDNKEELIKYLDNVKKSATNLLKLDLPIIKELKPWLDRVIQERDIVEKIVNDKLKKVELLKFLENDKFSGSEILDNLIKKHNLLTDEEYANLIKKRRGNPWYRIWEDKK